MIELAPTRASELSSFAFCQKRWKYQYVDNIDSKKIASPLVMGSAAHRMLEVVNDRLQIEEVYNEMFRELRENIKAKGSEISDPEGYYANYGLLITDAYERVLEFSRREKEFINSADSLHTELRFDTSFYSGRKISGTVDRVYKYQDQIWALDWKLYVRQRKPLTFFDKSFQRALYSKVLKAEYGDDFAGFIFFEIGPKPVRPKLTKFNILSKAKGPDKISFAEAVLHHGLDMADYAEFYESLPDDNFSTRHTFPYDEAFTEATLEEMARVVTLMDKARSGEIPVIRTSDAKTCAWCQYKTVCLSPFTGMDTDWLLKEEFQTTNSNYEITNEFTEDN